MLNTPVAFFIFKRPQTTARVFERIAAARPRQLFIIADGPRTPAEAPECEQARAITERIDWECQVFRQYAETNLGLKRRLVSGLGWLFEQVEAAIILEDDCLPDMSFFRFCNELLDTYRDEPRVMHISGDNFLRQTRVGESYYFSHYAHVWGWATWRRAWQHYDPDLHQLTTEAEVVRFLSAFQHAREKRFWADVIRHLHSGELDTWDFQWVMSCMRARGLAVNPAVNLVSNIGFGADATHTLDVKQGPNKLASHTMSFPLRAPLGIERNVAADDEIARQFFFTAAMSDRIRSRVGRTARALMRRQA